MPEYPISEHQAFVSRHGAHESEDGVRGQLSDVSKAGVEQISLDTRHASLTNTWGWGWGWGKAKMGRSYVKHFLATLRAGTLSVEASLAGGVSSSPVGDMCAAFRAWYGSR